MRENTLHKRRWAHAHTRDVNNQNDKQLESGQTERSIVSWVELKSIYSFLHLILLKKKRRREMVENTNFICPAFFHFSLVSQRRKAIFLCRTLVEIEPPWWQYTPEGTISKQAEKSPVSAWWPACCTLKNIRSTPFSLILVSFMCFDEEHLSIQSIMYPGAEP